MIFSVFTASASKWFLESNGYRLRGMLEGKRKAGASGLERFPFFKRKNNRRN